MAPFLQNWYHYNLKPVQELGLGGGGGGWVEGGGEGIVALDTAEGS